MEVLSLNPEDFLEPFASFADPTDCPFACALKRNGYTGVLTGTLGASVKVDGLSAEVFVTGVFLNGKSINQPPCGFGPNEFDRIQKELEQNPAAKAWITVQHLN